MLSDLLKARGVFVSTPPEAPTRIGVAAPVAAVGGLFGPAPVADSPDLQRILALPRRDLDLAMGPELDVSLRRRSAECRPSPHGTDRCPDCNCPLELWPLQRVALVEMLAAGGELGALPVSNGKTIVAQLAGTVMGAKNTLLLVPAQVRPKSLRFDWPLLSKHWRVPNLAGEAHRYSDTDAWLHVLSFEELSSPKNAHFLDDSKFDLIVCDEAHKLRNPTASRTKRFLRFLRERAAAGRPVRCVFLTGSLTKTSIRDYAHLSRHALQLGSPVPSNWVVIQEWAEVLDARDPDKPAPPPGALLRLCTPTETPADGYQRRLRQTLGVIIASDQQVKADLRFDVRNPPVPEAIAKAISGVWSGWVTPSGVDLADDIARHRASRELAAGFFYWPDWTKARPHTVDERKEWLEVRRLWFGELREALKRAKPGLDSPLLLTRAAARGKWQSQWYAKWAAIRDWFDLDAIRETTWVSDFLLKDAIEWGREAPGIIWYEHAAWGPRLAELAPDFKFFGPGERASAAIQTEGQGKGERTIIACSRTHGTGKDLQRAFHRNLFPNPFSGGDLWQQVLGRTHRSGQPRDVVSATVYWHDASFRDALRTGLTHQRYGFETLGERQKLLLADYSWNVDDDDVVKVAA